MDMFSAKLMVQGIIRKANSTDNFIRPEFVSVCLFNRACKLSGRLTLLGVSIRLGQK